MKGSSLPTTAVAALLAALALAASPPSAAQGAGDSDLARRTFQNAEQLQREGKQEQAIRDFLQVLQSFPESEFADDALMRLGGFEYPAESLADLGSAGTKAQDAARPYFEQVRERYPQSDSAPHALYKLGLLALEPSSIRRNLDDAYASFSRVVNIYPESRWVGRAYLGGAYSELAKYQYDRAILGVEKALEETYGGTASAEAHFFLGVANARMGEFERAAEAFQRARNRDPQGGFAAPALEWLTLIYRTRLLPSAGRPPRFNPVASFVPRMPAGEDLRGEIHMAVSTRGELLVADPRRGAVLTFDRSGTITGMAARPEPLRVAFDAYGNLMVAAPDGIVIAGAAFPAARNDNGKVRLVSDMAGIWRDSQRNVWVLDAGGGELLRYETGPNTPRVVVSDKAAGVRMSAMAAGPEDRLYVLDSRKDALMMLDGSSLKPVGGPGGPVVFQDSADLAVDLLGNIYVLDARRGAVVVLAPDGRELSVISPPAGSPQALEDPGCVAVGPAGEVYVYDKRKRTIVLFD
jgi:TolA-binding protein/sugar lactone lactonase YvrE